MICICSPVREIVRPPAGQFNVMPHSSPDPRAQRLVEGKRGTADPRAVASATRVVRDVVAASTEVPDLSDIRIHRRYQFADVDDSLQSLRMLGSTARDLGRSRR